MGEPDVRDAAPLGVPDLLAELLRAGGHLGRDAAAAQPVGELLGRRPRVLVGEGDEHRAGDGAAARQHAVGDQRDQGAGDAERDAHARVRRAAVAGQGVVASAGAHGLEPFVAGHEDLEDGAGVVVEAAGDAQVDLDRDAVADSARTAVDDGSQLLEPGVEQLVVDTESTHALDERGVGDADGRQGQARLGLFGRGARGLDEQGGDGLGGLLVELVDGADRGRDVGDAEAAVEALDQLAVVELERQRRQGQLPEGLDHHPHHLDVVVERQLVTTDDVDVGLVELAVAAFLRALAAPGRLDLVAAEGELQLAGVLQDVTGERHGEVEVQTQPRVAGPFVSVQPAEDVDLLVDLAALGQALERLDRAGLDVGEPVQLEGARETRDRPRARRPARQAGTRDSRSAAWAWTTGSQSSGAG